MKRIIFGLALLLAVTESVADPKTTVQTALNNIASDIQDTWAFTETTIEGEIEYVGRYDPRHSRGERWELQTVDGRAPTTDEFDEYNEDKNDDQDYQENDGDADDEEDMQFDLIDMNTLELIEATDTYWIYGFVPTAGDDDDEEAEAFMREVSGRLKIIRDGHYVEYIRLENQKPIKPAFGVKIKKFLTLLTFGPATFDGPIVPLSVDVVVAGRAMLAIKINETEMFRFSDYEYVGQNLASD